jgi:TPR repeat protein
VDTTTTSSTPVPYSFEYGIFTLTVQSRRNDGTLQAVQTFQQKGIYNTLYGIPLGGRGHHPAHAVIEDAAKWVNGGGLTNQRQSSLQPTQPHSSPIADAGTTLQARAQAGDAQAQYLLGVAYNRGDGVPQDYAQAALWYRRAADQGDVNAQYNLGVVYGLGQGVPQDSVQAAAWTRKAADQGDASAQYNLGTYYSIGQGVPQDYAQTVFWTRKAADQGLAEAQEGLGLLYHNGQGVPLDYAQAATWWRKAAEQGLADAQYELGLLCFMGRGVPQDNAESYFWLDLAALGKLGSTNLDDVIKLRDLSASQLSPTDLSQAQARASKWFAEHSISR